MKIQVNLKKAFLFLSLFSYMTSLLSLNKNTFLWAKEAKLQKTSLNLFLNEEAQLKLLHKKSGEKVTFKSDSPSICEVSSSGRLLGVSPGKTSISVTLISKKGKRKKKLKAKVTVGNIILASTQKNLERGLKNPNGNILLLKPKKETSFRIPKGRFHYSLQVDMGKSQKDFHLKTDKDSFLREIQVKYANKVSFGLEGELSSLSLMSGDSTVSITTFGKKSLLSQVLVQAKSYLSLHANSTKATKHTTKIYLSKQSNLSISGKSPSLIEVYAWKDASDSRITSDRTLHYYSGVPSVLELKKGAESSLIRTLDYKVPITVRNYTSSVIEVNTPSLLKTISVGEEKTVSGKR